MTKADDITASYKFRSLEHFLSSGDFKPFNEGVQTNKQAGCITVLPSDTKVILR